uniref:hypothetical protein n=1 Tax=Streptomyces sp. NRRL S-325 TaxID=1463899 RepID=UPI0005665E56|nr:hypothetical protein [Streptomyces sp. NRRL S-325]
MTAQALNVLFPEGSGRTLRTVAQSGVSRNLLILLGAVAGCVINGDTVTSILRQGTWLVVVLIILTVIRIIETRVRRRRGGAGRPPGDIST